MSRRLALFIGVTDTLMIAYWLFAAVVQLGLLHVPPDWMYANYDKPYVVAWNWSFLPLDLAFSIAGAAAVAASRRGNAAWRPLALVSLVLTATSGLMAVSYWIIAREFDPSWFVTNLVLLVWPLCFIRPLIWPAGGAR